MLGQSDPEQVFMSAILFWILMAHQKGISLAVPSEAHFSSDPH